MKKQLILLSLFFSFFQYVQSQTIMGLKFSGPPNYNEIVSVDLATGIQTTLYTTNQRGGSNGLHFNCKDGLLHNKTILPYTNPPCNPCTDLSHHAIDINNGTTQYEHIYPIDGGFQFNAVGYDYLTDRIIGRKTLPNTLGWFDPVSGLSGQIGSASIPPNNGSPYPEMLDRQNRKVFRIVWDLQNKYRIFHFDLSDGSLVNNVQINGLTYPTDLLRGIEYSHKTGKFIGTISNNTNPNAKLISIDPNTGNYSVISDFGSDVEGTTTNGFDVFINDVDDLYTFMGRDTIGGSGLDDFFLYTVDLTNGNIIHDPAYTFDAHTFYFNDNCECRYDYISYTFDPNSCNGNTYSASVVVGYDENPITGNLNVSLGIPGTQPLQLIQTIQQPVTTSPQTFIFNNIPFDPAIDEYVVYASFDDEPACFTYYKVPTPTDCNCEIYKISDGGNTICDPATGNYAQTLIVEYRLPPTTGNLVVNGHTFPITGSPQTVTVELPANELPVDVTAYFSDEPSCTATFSDVATAPENCSCTIDDITASGQGSCNSATNTYTQFIQVYFTNPPASGDLIIETSNGYTFTEANYSSPESISMTLPADGNYIDITAYFEDDPNCIYFANNLFKAKDPCFASSCAEPVEIFPGTPYMGNNSDGNSNINTYNISSSTNWTAPEQIHFFNSNGGATKITLTNMSADLDLFLAAPCDPESIFEFSYETNADEEINVTLNSGTYYLYVDGWAGATSAYTLTVSQPQSGIYSPEMDNCENLITNFMDTYDIPGLSMALTKDGKLVYHRAFGNVDVGNTETAYPYHLFRIASLSKPITSVGIMKLYEDGFLNMNDKVFGVGGILENHPYLSYANITDARIYDITVQHLLEHSGGWNRGLNCFPNPTTPYPWFFGGCDPIVAPLHVAQEIGASNPTTEEDMIYFLLEKGLDFDPGTQYQYSNIGYLMLGEIIEEISGMEYESFMKTQIFDPIHAYDMHLGKNLITGKFERESEYVGNGFTTKDCYGNGTNVPWEYGGLNLEAMGAHGGWIASSRDLTRLLVAVDGFATKPDILNPSTLGVMTTPSVNNSSYAKGWSVNGAPNWWHFGSLDGTYSFLARSANGYTWALFMNKRIIGGNAGAFQSAVDGLPWNCIANTSTFPTHDLFATPTVNASDMTFSHLSNASCQSNWTSGNGDKRIVVMRKGFPVNWFPVDGISYNADADLSTSANMGNNNFVVYDGTSENVTLTGLEDDATYYFRVFEYNENATTGNHKLYHLARTEQFKYFSGCLDSYVLLTVEQDTYKAINSIQTNAEMPAFDVFFQAEQTVDLLQGFSTNLGYSFEVNMQICN